MYHAEVTNIDLVKLQAEAAYKQLQGSIDGVDEKLAWGAAELQPGEWLNTGASILSVVTHVADCKFMYASASYRNCELRMRDLMAKEEAWWPNWEAAKAYLQEAHEYWISSWTNETDLERDVMHFTGKLIPSWKILWTMTDHDGYHAGQIHMLRTIVKPSDNPPRCEVEDWEKFAAELPVW